ncbi:MAG: hybrid sensor histidine kinase/response regulator [Ignavibacteriae bacterium]|nr:MAG: hybrid sensor histidine kinase/response regulator [Ignavibacteriota bacterium]
MPMTARPNILIVEDSPTQTKLLRLILEENGYHVEAAEDGKNALECVRTRQPDLIITDIVMPEMDGFALCKALKSDPRTKSIPVMLLTSLSDPEDVIKGLQAGADNFLTKPYEDTFLVSCIQNIFANLEMRKKRSTSSEIEIMFAGQKYHINSDRMQIIDLLLSTYENAVQKNNELHKAHNDLMEAHRQLEQKNYELEKVNREKTHFLSVAAHDLRNPLTIIYTTADLITEELKEKTSAETIEFLEMIKQSSKFMRDLIEELLDVSVIDSGKLSINLELVDLMELIRNNVSLNRVIAGRKQITVEFNPQKDLPLFPLDRKKIEQVFNNLISNAIKYSYPKSRVSIDAKREKDNLVIAVHDTGQGIPPAEMDKLFKPFPRLSVKTTSGESSTGLGLVIVRKIVEAHNGKVWAESRLNIGTTFKISLPIP